MHERHFLPNAKAVPGGRHRRARPSRLGNTAILFSGALALLSFGACGGEAGAGEHEVVRAGLGTPGGGAGGMPAKVDMSADNVKKGEEVFNGRCVSCHGPGGEGKIGMGPALASQSFLEAASDEMLMTTVLKGRVGTTMIPWEGAMTHEEVGQVVSYLRSLAPHEAVELDESPLQGEAEMGEDLYRSICARCHGNSGAGYSESSSGTGIGRKAFLDVASDGYIRHIAKHGKSGTKMRPFEEGAPTAVANLTDVEIDSIIAYLRAQAW